jgi:uncharacterized protein (DUF849 family)
MLQACLNGARMAAEHQSLPITPEELALEAAASCEAGADDLHIHPKDSQGRDSLEPDIVAATLLAVRGRVGSLTVGVTTGLWAADVVHRHSLVARWLVMPDHVSINFHEDGSESLVRLCLNQGIAVDAGLWTGSDALDRLFDSGLAGECRYLLVEATGSDLESELRRVSEMLRRLATVDVPVLLHGVGVTAWPLLAEAARRGLSSRIGFEDTLAFADGELAASNAQLVHAAISMMTSEQRQSR